MNEVILLACSALGLVFTGAEPDQLGGCLVSFRYVTSGHLKIRKNSYGISSISISILNQGIAIEAYNVPLHREQFWFGPSLE